MEELLSSPRRRGAVEQLLDTKNRDLSQENSSSSIDYEKKAQEENKKAKQRLRLALLIFSAFARVPINFCFFEPISLQMEISNVSFLYF
jgi:hypothetical protein